jgi:hypothetical protein
MIFAARWAELIGWASGEGVLKEDWQSEVRVRRNAKANLSDNAPRREKFPCFRQVIFCLLRRTVSPSSALAGLA